MFQGVVKDSRRRQLLQMMDDEDDYDKLTQPTDVHGQIIEPYRRFLNNNSIYSSVMKKVIALRAGEAAASDNDNGESDNTTTNSWRKRRKRKRVQRGQQHPTTEKDVQHKQKEDVKKIIVDNAAMIDDSALSSNNIESEQQNRDQRKRRRRRMFSSSSNKDDDSIDDKEDNNSVSANVIGTDDEQGTRRKVSSSNSDKETRQRKRRRRKNINAADDELNRKDIGMDEQDDSILRQTGDTFDDEGSSVETPSIDAIDEVDNMEISQEFTPRIKRRKRKKRVINEIITDDGGDVKEEEHTPVTEDEDMNEDNAKESSKSRTKKRRRKKREIDNPVPISSDDSDIVASNEEEQVPEEGTDTTMSIEEEQVLTEDSIDTSTMSIDASVDIPSEEIVPESIGSTVEVDKTLVNVVPMEDESVQEPSEAEEVDHIDGTMESSLEEKENCISSNDNSDEEIVDESTMTPVDEMSEELEIVEDSVTTQPDEGASDVIDRVVIDADVEIPDEAIVPESIGASLEVEENVLPGSIEPGVDEEHIMSVRLTREEEEGHHDDGGEGVEMLEEELNEEIPESIGNESETLTMIQSEEAKPLEGSDIHEKEVVADVPDEEEIVDKEEATAGEDDSVEDAEDNNVEASIEEENEMENEDEEGEVEKEEEGDTEQASWSEMSEIFLASSNSEDVDEENVTAIEEQMLHAAISDQPMQQSHEIETDKTVPNEEEVPSEGEPSSQLDDAIPQSNDEEEAVEKVPFDQDVQSIDVGIVSEKEEANTDQTLEDTIELKKMDDDCLTLSVVTWNLGEAAFSEKEASFLTKFRRGKSKLGSDLVLIGAQECEDIKPRRTEGHRSRHLRRVGIQMLGQDYVPLAIHSLGGIQMALYCHRDVLGDVEMISIADVTCGVGNVFHNKGAIGVYLKMKRVSGKGSIAKSSRILIATGHLAAHVKNVDARNGDFKRIISELEAQAPPRFLRPKRNPDGTASDCDGSHLLNSMDHVFFAGDLNYRIDLPREYVERCIIDIKDNQLSDRHEEVDGLMNKLLRRDQLLQTIASGRAFSQFSEGKITFLPTFKFDKGTQNYDTSHKQRVPAWTDRILFRSNKVKVLEYQSVPDALHSDHRPVFGTFQVGWGISTAVKETSRSGRRGKRSRKK